MQGPGCSDSPQASLVIQRKDRWFPNPKADLLLGQKKAKGSGPGASEDAEWLPLSGAAGHTKSPRPGPPNQYGSHQPPVAIEYRDWSASKPRGTEGVN